VLVAIAARAFASEVILIIRLPIRHSRLRQSVSDAVSLFD
jgi:hypothetical protein